MTPLNRFARFSPKSLSTTMMSSIGGRERRMRLTATGVVGRAEGSDSRSPRAAASASHSSPSPGGLFDIAPAPFGCRPRSSEPRCGPAARSRGPGVRCAAGPRPRAAGRLVRPAVAAPARPAPPSGARGLCPPSLSPPPSTTHTNPKTQTQKIKPNHPNNPPTQNNTKTKEQKKKKPGARRRAPRCALPRRAVSGQIDGTTRTSMDAGRGDQSCAIGDVDTDISCVEKRLEPPGDSCRRRDVGWAPYRIDRNGSSRQVCRPRGARAGIGAIQAAEEASRRATLSGSRVYRGRP